VIHEPTAEVLYTYRLQGSSLAAPVYAEGPHTIRYGAERPDRVAATGLLPRK
jgi:hypothetical protein